MSSKKACKICKRIYESDNCPGCQSNESVRDFKGKIIIFDPEKSEIAKSVGIDKIGEYAIKVK